MPTKNEILAVRALRDRKSRQNNRKFVVEGLKGVAEAWASGWTVESVYATSDQSVPEGWGAITVPVKDMGRMSTMKTPPGVLAVVHMREGREDAPDPSVAASLPLDFPQISLALDGLSDPGNLGTILRTADWFGIRDLWVSPDTVDAFNPKVVQSTMGAIFRMRVWPVDLVEFLNGAREQGVSVHGLDLKGRSIWDEGDIRSGSPRIAVVGSESHGLSDAVKAACTELVHIPGGGAGESLNASIAAGICMAAWQRHAKPHADAQS